MARKLKILLLTLLTICVLAGLALHLHTLHQWSSQSYWDSYSKDLPPGTKITLDKDSDTDFMEGPNVTITYPVTIADAGTGMLDKVTTRAAFAEDLVQNPPTITVIPDVNSDN